MAVLFMMGGLGLLIWWVLAFDASGGGCMVLLLGELGWLSVGLVALHWAAVAVNQRNYFVLCNGISHVCPVFCWWGEFGGLGDAGWVPGGQFWLLIWGSVLHFGCCWLMYFVSLGLLAWSLSAWASFRFCVYFLIGFVPPLLDLVLALPCLLCRCSSGAYCGTSERDRAMPVMCSWRFLLFWFVVSLSWWLLTGIFFGGVPSSLFGLDMSSLHFWAADYDGCGWISVHV